MRRIKLSGTGPLHSPTQQKIAVSIELQDPRVALAIGDINISLAVKGNVCRLIEVQNIVTRDSHSPKRQEDAAFRTQLQDNVCANISCPEVVLAVDSQGVWRHKKVIGNAADILSGRIEFHERMPAAMEYIDVSFRTYRDTAALDEILTGRQLKEIWNCLVIKFGNAWFGASLRKCGVA